MKDQSIELSTAVMAGAKGYKIEETEAGKNKKLPSQDDLAKFLKDKGIEVSTTKHPKKGLGCVINDKNARIKFEFYEPHLKTENEVYENGLVKGLKRI